MNYEFYNNKSNDSLVKEDVVQYGKQSFEKVFAARTLANLEFISKEVEKRHAQGIVDKDITDVFEVTQLINSFVGMLIIPKESFFNQIDNKDRFASSRANELLKRLSSDDKRYRSTYTFEKDNKWFKESLSPKNLAKHFRNAVAHNHLEILPKDLKGNGSITGVEFSDYDGYGNEFRLELSVGEIKVLLKELCALFLRYA